MCVLSSVPFLGSKLGHNLQTSFNNNGNSLVQDQSNLFHQLNKKKHHWDLKADQGVGVGVLWGKMMGVGGKQERTVAGVVKLPGIFLYPQ